MPAFPTDEFTPNDRPLLAFDTGSPQVSVAVVAPNDDPNAPQVLAERCLEQRASSKELIPAARDVLADAGLRLDDLGGLVALRGPGSFTGLRIGLATVMGLEQTTALPVAAVSTLHALAVAGAAQLGDDAHAGDELHAAVDALRGEWSVQRFTIRPGDQAPHKGPRSVSPVTPATLVSAATLCATPGLVIGFGCPQLDPPPTSAPRASLVEPPSLARWAGHLAFGHAAAWDKALLMRPLYARAPAVTLPTPRP